MRSSKSRSRSKSNRSRSVGNIQNRVFDSSGPEGKVRGTPQQIIDKYTQLARDAQLSNDRVAAENFQQHAEHYTRLLGEAQREMDARREQHEAQQGGNQQGNAQQNGSAQNGGHQNDAPQGGGRQNGGQPGPSEQGGDRPGGEQRDATGGGGRRKGKGGAGQSDPQRDDQPAAAEAEATRADAGSTDDTVIDFSEGSDSTLVETPESAPKPARSRTRKPKAKPAPDDEPRGSSDAGDASDTTETVE